MGLDSSQLRRHYEWLSDAALFAIDRNELVENARRLYDEEVARREPPRPVAEEENEEDPVSQDFLIDSGPEPEWLSSAGSAFVAYPGKDQSDLQDVAGARLALRAAQIPFYVILRTYKDDTPPTHELSVMVPGEMLHSATSVLDIEIFNPRIEEEFRISLKTCTDEQFNSLNPNDFCAGLLDRAARLRRAYEDEAARREAKGEHEAQSA